MARPTPPGVARSDSMMEGSTGAMMRRSTETRNARRNSRASAFIRSSIEKIRPTGPRERGQVPPPGGFQAWQRRARLDRPADPVGAADEIDGQLLPLELVGRPLPPEAPWRLPARLDDQGQVGHVGSEARRVGKECRSRWSPYH